MTLFQRAVSTRPPEGWSFTATEVTAGMYLVRGIGPDGLAIERHGTDETRLLDQLIQDAVKLAR
jgi:hypothetical protein